MEYKNLLTEIKDSIGLIKINRPMQLNALNTETIHELNDIAHQWSRDEKIKVIIITGEGKAFVAGADIAEMKDMTRQQAIDFSEMGQKVFSLIESQDRPVIAAVNGFALGGGCELAMACDIRIASEKAKLGQPEVNLGVIPGFAGTQRLARMVGAAKAKELILTADMVDAQTALNIGLVNQVVSHDSLMDVCMEMARKIASKGPTAVRLAKRVIIRGVETDFATGSSFEVDAFGECFASGDAKEGMEAFLQKRKPNWIS
ncbi:MAG: enoyl-CoA hydratase-related protein [candidate division Zixibacteria bacterium]|nr:enoyl-CoA hydratase-related protein [candidate division Zixibacteria bacterium]